jgi:hypothetical protein
MSEGELKKRIFDKRDSWCFCGGETEDIEPRSCKIKGEPTKEEIKQALDEAAKEFPRYGIGNTTENAVFDGINKTVVWFKKWFGGA